MTRLNLGCGRDIRPGWINIDRTVLPGVDFAIDLDQSPVFPLPDDSVDVSEANHVLEHLVNPLPMMAELWRVTRPGGTLTVRCPYGSSDDADEDPTHVRRLFLGSWGYFGQPHYWRADYGYRGDWRAECVHLFITSAFAPLPDLQLCAAIQTSRNVVLEMVAKLTAVKPARPADRELQTPPIVKFERGDLSQWPTNTPS